MPKASAKEKAASEEAVKDPISGFEAPTADEEPKEEQPKKAKKTSFDVYNAGGTFIRTYSVEQHGKDAEKLAAEYAKKLSGSVK